MFNSLHTGVTALRSFNKGIETVGDNIANVNSTGFKASRVEYSSNFVETLERSSAAPGDGEPNSASRLQIGGGVQIDAITADFSQGNLVNTGYPTDLAIDGAGFFEVQEIDSAGSATGNTFFTRAGNFQVDNQGYIVSTDGYRLVDTADSSINVAYTPTSSGVVLDSIDVGLDGQVKLMLSDGTIDETRGIVKLQDFNDPQALTKLGKGFYKNDTANSAGAITTSVVPGNSGLGLIRSKTLELSNVDLTEQFANMITTQRSFQAGAKIVTTSDQILSEAINLKR